MKTNTLIDSLFRAGGLVGFAVAALAGFALPIVMTLLLITPVHSTKDSTVVPESTEASCTMTETCTQVEWPANFKPVYDAARPQTIPPSCCCSTGNQATEKESS